MVTLFLLNKNPHCSSLLPQKNNIKDWYLAHRFKVKKKLK